MGKPKPREYIVHEVLTVTNAYVVEASSKQEALAAAKERNGSDWMSEAVPTGGWFVEPRTRKTPDHMICSPGGPDEG